MSHLIVPIVEQWPRDAATFPIEWSGNPDDDCTSKWVGLMLRAEMMERGSWRWAIYDERTAKVLADAHALGNALTGTLAGAAGEDAARMWLHVATPHDSWTSLPLAAALQPLNNRKA